MEVIIGHVMSITSEDDPELILPKKSWMTISTSWLLILVNADFLFFDFLQETLVLYYWLSQPRGVTFLCCLLLFTLFHDSEVIIKALISILNDKRILHLHWSWSHERFLFSIRLPHGLIRILNLGLSSRFWLPSPRSLDFRETLIIPGVHRVSKRIIEKAFLFHWVFCDWVATVRAVFWVVHVCQFLWKTQVCLFSKRALVAV